MEINKSLKKAHIVFIILGSIFIILSIFHQNLWFDEAYSVGMAKQNIIDIWEIGSNDVHPILYYWILRIINLLTNASIVSYRIFSSIPIILLGILGITHIKKEFGEKVGIIFSFLCYFLPVMSVYANEIRMYSWAAYISTVFAIYSYRIYIKEYKLKNWIIFGITSLTSIYIHYYCLLLVGVINILLLICFIKNKRWKDLKKQFFIGIILFILYLPWIIKMFLQIKHVTKGFWIEFEFPKTVLQLIGFYMGGTINIYMGFIANIILFFILLLIYYKKRNLINMKPVINIVKIYLIIIIIAISISVIFKTSILYYRYLFILIGLYIFIISFLLSKVKKQYLLVICIVIFLLGVVSNIIQIQDNYAKENGKQIEYLRKNMKENDVIVYMNNEVGAVIAINFLNNKQYFYNPENWGVADAYKVWAPQMETHISTEFINKCKGRVWVIDSQDYKCYNQLFNNGDFKIITKQYFETKYQNYSYNIILVERFK